MQANSRSVSRKGASASLQEGAALDPPNRALNFLQEFLWEKFILFPCAAFGGGIRIPSTHPFGRTFSGERPAWDQHGAQVIGEP